MLSGHEVIVVDNFFTGRYVPLTWLKCSEKFFGTKFYILVLLISH